MLCNEAVAEGAFEKHVGFLCPTHQSLIGDIAEGEQPPAQLVCQSCEAMGEEKYQYRPSECQKVTFYKIVKDG